jgi:hypothetical protein
VYAAKLMMPSGKVSFRGLQNLHASQLHYHSQQDKSDLFSCRYGVWLPVLYCILLFIG